MSRALHKPLSRSILLLGCLAAALSSCRTSKSVVEAVEVKPSGFLTHAKDLKEDRQRSPFLLNWWSTDKRLLAAADRCRKIYVAPVAYDQVRADNTIVAAVEHDAAWRTRHLPAMAQYIRTKFGDAFRKAKDPRYAVVDAPAADALTLQLSLLEWGPNTYTGVLSRQVVDFFTFNVGGEEYAKIVLLISIQDFRRNGQAYFAVKEWAAQLEKLLRAKPGEKVSDSLPAVLFNY
jgi:hypothetical protein